MRKRTILLRLPWICCPQIKTSSCPKLEMLFQSWKPEAKAAESPDKRYSRAYVSGYQFIGDQPEDAIQFVAELVGVQGVGWPSRA